MISRCATASVLVHGYERLSYVKGNSHVNNLFILKLMNHSVYFKATYDTIRYDSVYLMCSKKLTDSQLSPPHGTNKKLKCETKNKMMTVITPPVQSSYREAVQ